MNTKTFDENYEVDRNAKGAHTTPKSAPIMKPEIKTADGDTYDSNQTYYFFDQKTSEIRLSTGLQRVGKNLSTSGLKIVPIARLYIRREDALADGLDFLETKTLWLEATIEDLKSTFGIYYWKIFLNLKVFCSQKIVQRNQKNA